MGKQRAGKNISQLLEENSRLKEENQLLTERLQALTANKLA